MIYGEIMQEDVWMYKGIIKENEIEEFLYFIPADIEDPEDNIEEEEVNL